ncbi:uncharacterized protein LOC131546326 [Onychostoma macrolepis]|uniref:uncharacterized protein LOC131546326 n=1 Tax=Onychostoma macrolepis TaxID=369639 RepID=UPI00272A4D39|nr:uncharacterized protein LOC131546326 [Onychostoma macrolepis]
MTPKRLKSFVVGCNNEHSSSHLLPSFERLKRINVRFCSEGNAPSIYLNASMFARIIRDPASPPEKVCYICIFWSRFQQRGYFACSTPVLLQSSSNQEMLEEQLRAREEDKWRMIDHWERRGCVPLTFPLRGSTSAPDPLHLPALSRAGGGGPAGSTHMSLYSGIGETLKHGPNLKLGCHYFHYMCEGNVAYASFFSQLFEQNV